jgi:prevent-host-death family protein
MKSVKAGEFKAKCLQLMDEVARSGEAIVVTKYGRPVAELVPARQRGADLFGALSGQAAIEGDIVTPLDRESGS